MHPGWTVTERTSDQIAAYASARGITEAAARVMLARDISIGRPVTAAELADVVTFLASPRSVAVNGDAIAAAAAPAAPSTTDDGRQTPEPVAYASDTSRGCCANGPRCSVLAVSW